MNNDIKQKCAECVYPSRCILIVKDDTVIVPYYCPFSGERSAKWEEFNDE